MEETKTTEVSKDETASRENLAKANDIVRNRVYWSMGAGLVPIAEPAKARGSSATWAARDPRPRP